MVLIHRSPGHADGIWQRPLRCAQAAVASASIVAARDIYGLSPTFRCLRARWWSGDASAAVAAVL